MKVIYVGLDARKRQSILETTDDVILLGFDRWDDFDYKTQFPVQCRIGGEPLELEAIKILIDDEMTSFSYLDNLVKSGWDGVFPIPETNYISVPAALTFYEQIEGRTSLEAAVEVARLLHDASYMVWLEEDDRCTEMIETEGFRKSLQRERGSVTAFLNGWKLFSRAEIQVANLAFHFNSPKGGRQTLNLRYDSNSLLPHDINVLIGPNGVGKSQALRQMVGHWLNLDPDHRGDAGFEESPNINQLVVVSYSPFERFPVDTNDVQNPSKDRQDLDVYRYFGLRGRRSVFNVAGEEEQKVRLSQSLPKATAADSLLRCALDDERYGGIKDWSAKLETMEDVLRTAIDFDYVAVVVEHVEDDEVFFDGPKDWVIGSDALVEIPAPFDHPDQRPMIVIPISSDRARNLLVPKIYNSLRASEGVIFLKDNNRVELSSGQRLFSYMVINILGAIRRNSLILIDEPELFLHPTLEISFITMLKTILANYRSKALLATHSLVAVRELPRDCVHVFDASGDGLVIKNPPFETFGGDIQRISSYVFGDKSVSKPFEAWLRERLVEYKSADALIHALGGDINEEMIIQIYAMEKGQW